MRNQRKTYSTSSLLFYRVVHIVVICMFMLIVATPVSAQIYTSTRYENPYNSYSTTYSGTFHGTTYRMAEASPAYESYQSSIYQPFGSISPRRNADRPDLPSVGNDLSTDNDNNNNDNILDDFGHPSDPGYASSPVGEAWVMLLFAATAAIVLTVKKRKPKNI